MWRILSIGALIFCMRLAEIMSLSRHHMFVSHSAIQLKNCRKTISIEEKLNLISECEIGEQIVDIGHNVRLAHSTAHTNCDSA